jgi:hypothetical protein
LVIDKKYEKKKKLTESDVTAEALSKEKVD